jgi:hypothetical protein
MGFRAGNGREVRTDEMTLKARADNGGESRERQISETSRAPTLINAMRSVQYAEKGSFVGKE